MPCFYLCYFLCLECPLFLFNAYLSFEMQPGSHLLQEVVSEPLNCMCVSNYAPMAPHMYLPHSKTMFLCPVPTHSHQPVQSESGTGLFALVTPRLALD